MTAQALDLGRGSKTSVYIEPELYAIALKVATDKNISYSTLVRGLLIGEFLKSGDVPQELLLKLAGVQA